jgi:hypothetical protein
MAVSCEPGDLASAAACFTHMTPPQRDAMKTYLLAVIAGGSLDPATLMASATCFMGLTPPSQKALQNYLLCQILNI